MRIIRLFVVAFMLTFAVSVGIAACSDDAGTCPGRICSDCAAGGDCNITCDAGEQEFCGHFGYFEDPTLRCAWCD
jgi:hypothetical protein